MVLFIGGGSLLLAAARGLDGTDRARLATALVVGGVLGLALLIFEIAATAPISRLLHGDDHAGPYGLAFFNRTASVLALVAWPLLFAVQRRFGNWPAVTGFALIGGVLIGLNTMAPTLALFVGLAVLVLALGSPRTAYGTLFVVIAILVVATPALAILAPALDDYLLASEIVEQGLNHRLLMWEFAADRLLERPWFGWGLDASRNLPGGNTVVEILVNRNGDLYPGELMPLHPHNALLQFWIELGVPGVLAAAVLFAMIVVGAARTIADRTARAAALATLVSGLVIAQLSFGIWQGWWQSALWLTAALTVAVAGVRAPAPDA